MANKELRDSVIKFSRGALHVYPVTEEFFVILALWFIYALGYSFLLRTLAFKFPVKGLEAMPTDGSFFFYPEIHYTGR